MAVNPPWGGMAGLATAAAAHPLSMAGRGRYRRGGAGAATAHPARAADRRRPAGGGGGPRGLRRRRHRVHWRRSALWLGTASRMAVQVLPPPRQWRRRWRPGVLVRPAPGAQPLPCPPASGSHLHGHAHERVGVRFMIRQSVSLAFFRQGGAWGTAMDAAPKLVSIIL